MTRIAALSIQTPIRPATAPASVHADVAASAIQTAAPAAPAVSAQNTPAPAPAAPALASGVMGALIDLQSSLHAVAPHAPAQAQQLLQSVVQTITDHSTSPAPAQTRTPTSLDHGAGPSSEDHGQASGHDGHVDHGQDGDHHDRGWRGRPPVTPPPVPRPQPTPAPLVIPSFDAGLPGRAIAQAAQILADGRAADAARTAFVTAAVQRRDEAFVSQGHAALAVCQAMQAEFGALQGQQGYPTGGFLRGLYA